MDPRLLGRASLDQERLLFDGIPIPLFNAPLPPKLRPAAAQLSPSFTTKATASLLNSEL